MYYDLVEWYNRLKYFASVMQKVLSLITGLTVLYL